MMKNVYKNDIPEIFENPIIRSDMEDIYSRNLPWDEFKNCTVLITGAYGMLASYLTFFFIWLNEEMGEHISIIAAVRNKEKAEKIFTDVLDKSYFKLYLKDINEKFEFEGDIDYIFHAASVANPKLYLTHPVEVAETNVISTYHLLNWASLHRIKGFLMFSSGDVYGKVQRQNIIKEDDMGIVNPLEIHSCYGESKRMAETWCMSYAKEYNIHTTIARLSHTYSPFMDLVNDSRVFASFVKDALGENDILILSDGTARRAFCYITDAIAAFLLIIIRGKSGEAYNVANSSGFITIKELGSIIAALTNGKSKVNIKGGRNDGYLENVNNHENCLIEDKLLGLGWSHSVSVEDGFRRVIEYKKHYEIL